MCNHEWRIVNGARDYKTYQEVTKVWLPVQGIERPAGTRNSRSSHLFPTRWTVRADSLSSILDNCQVLQELWKEVLPDTQCTEMRARLIGVSNQMKKFSFLFGVALGKLIFRHSDNLSRTLQKSDTSAAEGQSIAAMTVATLRIMRTDDGFNSFWSRTCATISDVDVEPPTAPRKRRVPRRFETGEAPATFPSSAEDHYRPIFEALDLICQSISDRFDQPGYRAYSGLETLLLTVTKEEELDSAALDAVKLYEGDFDTDLLASQLKTFGVDWKASCSSSCVSPTFADILSYAVALSPAQVLLAEVCTLIKLILVMPATNAASERSFSAMRRVKSYLRTTMTQGRLNHLMLLHLHKDRTKSLEEAEVARRVDAGSEDRLSLFGRF